MTDIQLPTHPLFVNVVGQKFGRLTAIERSENTSGGQARFLCLCKCGQKRIIAGNHLRGGYSKSCGCLQKEKARKLSKDEVGKRFSKLVVLKRDGSNEKSHALFLCQCDCGKQIITTGIRLRRGQATSCGCSRSSGKGSRMNRIRQTIPGNTAKRHLFSTYKYWAKKRNLPFELEERLFFEIVEKNCHYCGLPPRRLRRENSIHGSAKINGVDRVDNTKGYTLDNSVPCCYICNHAKRDMLLSDFLSWVKQVYHYQNDSSNDK